MSKFNSKTIATTFQATVFVGLREGYGDSRPHQLYEARDICQAYADEMKIGLTLRHTEFIYPGDREPGVEVGLINYPRFPAPREEIRDHAIELAKRLMIAFSQERATIVTSQDTIMLEREAGE